LGLKGRERLGKGIPACTYLHMKNWKNLQSSGSTNQPWVSEATSTRKGGGGGGKKDHKKKKRQLSSNGAELHAQRVKKASRRKESRAQKGGDENFLSRSTLEGLREQLQQERSRIGGGGGGCVFTRIALTTQPR